MVHYVTVMVMMVLMVMMIAVACRQQAKANLCHISKLCYTPDWFALLVMLISSTAVLYLTRLAIYLCGMRCSTSSVYRALTHRDTTR